ncbi:MULTISPECIES: hypothetical protein [unclassified Streptomyces]|uniref:hypothetical protein n=1 Tax=unclassified Streptomyces TaxID=2593676 RepID=UPI002E8203E9|nr:hypothetical protein [Streptomyces sp. NBC_00589]WTI35491.1 hypothetical protein OIC96_11050 [Streptomyces sp. NBC_00775]WUB30836.1 hypothetical protein OHA51_38680 [Streptomyces sp. NBC_00589]
MLRGTTARTLFVVLAAVLIALQLFTPTESFASAHKGEVASCAEAEHPQKAAPPLGARRHVRDEDDLVPETPARALLAGDPAEAYPPASLTAAHPRTSMASTALSPAGLQVFRC